jgi:hypothetical protein
MSLTEMQQRSIDALTDEAGQRFTGRCGGCRRETPIHVDGEGKAWWLCGDCLARRLNAEVTHTVEVFGREDGTYVFANRANADRFADAVRQAGGDCAITKQTVCSSRETDALIATELAD